MNTRGEIIECILKILEEYRFDIRGIEKVPLDHAILVSKVITAPGRVTSNGHNRCNPLLINIILLNDGILCNDIYNNHIHLYFCDPNFLDQLEQLATNGKISQ